MKEGINGCSIINDYYNSDLGSLEIALQYLKNQKRNSKKTLILSDILQSVKNPEEFYTKLNNLLLMSFWLFIISFISSTANPLPFRKMAFYFASPSVLLFLPTFLTKSTHGGGWDVFLSFIFLPYFSESIPIKAPMNFDWFN